MEVTMESLALFSESVLRCFFFIVSLIIFDNDVMYGVFKSVSFSSGKNKTASLDVQRSLLAPVASYTILVRGLIQVSWSQQLYDLLSTYCTARVTSLTDGSVS